MSDDATIRMMTTADIAGGLHLCRACNWNQLEGDWRVFLESPGSGAVLAESGKRILGTAAWVRYDSLAWIAMMLVDPAERGKGLGRKLLAEAMSSVADAPHLGLDATSAGQPLYRHFGFVGSFPLARTKVTVDVARLPDASEDTRPMTATDLPAVCTLDRNIFGADRGALLARLFSLAPACAWVATGPDGITGYTFGRPGYRYHQIGPIVASHHLAAQALLARCLAQLHGGEVALDVPVLNEEWLGFLMSVGFQEERRFLRMFLCNNVAPGFPARQFAICGPEFA